jgi:hypothetical protein
MRRFIRHLDLRVPKDRDQGKMTNAVLTCASERPRSRLDDERGDGAVASAVASATRLLDLVLD